MNTEPTEEEIQARLAGSVVAGPRSFMGRTLAPYTAGLRDLVLKVVKPEDTIWLHDLVLLKILADAHGETPEERLEKRRALIVGTDDVVGFRAAVSLEFMDELTDAQLREARQLANEILEPVQLAEVAVVGTKKKSGEEDDAHRAPLQQLPTETPS